MPPESPAVGTTTRSTHLSLASLVAALIGLVLLVLTVREVGWSAVVQGINSVGVWFLAVVVLGGVRFAARARAWQVCAKASAEGEPGQTFDFPHAFGAMLAADALGNMTPLGLLASEPARVLLVRRRLSTVAGISSVAADNVFYTLSVFVMILAGTMVFMRRTTVPAELTVVADVVIGVAAIGLLAGIWIARRQPALLSWLAGVATRWTGRRQAAAERLLEVERRFYGLLQWPARRLLHIAGWHALFQLAAVTESYLVLRLLLGGAQPSIVDAFLLETAGRFITVAFKFVPYRLGVDEAGTALAARALALDPTIGVSMALVRRIRILVWNGVGLALLARYRS